jgi:hypothetical protein
MDPDQQTAPDWIPPMIAAPSSSGSGDGGPDAQASTPPPSPGPAPGDTDNPMLAQVAPPDQALADENALMAKAKTQDNIDDFCDANHDARESLSYLMAMAPLGKIGEGAALAKDFAGLALDGYNAAHHDDLECFWDKIPPDATVSATQIPPTQNACTPDPQTLPADFAPPPDAQVCQ